MSAYPNPAQTARQGKNRSIGTFLFVLSIYVLLLAGYIWLRYVGRSVDGDAVNLTEASTNLFTEGVLSSTGYSHGYAYPALNTFLAHLTGVSIWSLQTALQPFLVVLLVPISYAAYRSLTGNSQIALLASLLLFLSPEFLFEATRSSHAKVTWLLALTVLFTLARSFRSDSASGRLVSWVIAFYLATFALISSNSFFASGYVFGIAFAFVATHSVLRLRRTSFVVPPQFRRLAYVTASTLLLVFVFVFYIYPPSGGVLQTLYSTVDKVSVFLFSVEPTSGVDPYGYTQSTWLSPWLYLALTSFNWIVLALSFAVWLRKGWLLWVRREDIADYQLLLWLLYASFGLLMALSVLVDLSGALSSNLQLRVFPHFLLVGIPLASEGFFAIVNSARRSQRALPGKAVSVLLGLLFSAFSLASLLKITNDPLVSHWWTFYSERDRRSVEWVASHVTNNRVWIGPDIRLLPVVGAFGNWRQRAIQFDHGGASTSARYILQSEISQVRADRAGEVLPDTGQLSKVYDVGGTELYYSRPQTLYQR